MQDAYIYHGARTPFGRHAGRLSGIRPDDLAGGLIRTVLEQSGFAPEQVEDVILGCANQAGEDGRNIGRHSALLAGLPVTCGGQTVNRLCASGLAAILDARRAVACGEGSLFVAGGVESMSRAPFALAKSAKPFSRSVEMFDTTVGARFPNPRITEEHGNDTMPETADNIGRELGIGRHESDVFAARSQALYEAARASGFIGEELVPVVADARKNDVVDADEHPRPSSTMEALGKLKSLHQGGVVTAGNASGVNDGAAVVLIGNRAVGEAAGIEPRARILSAAVAGVEPRLMGLGPVPAIDKALERAGLSLADIDVIEINEAFATQVLGCLKQLGLPFDDARVNPNGGAIAVGHPLGASGARLTLTALRQLERTGGRYAVVSLCIGVGQGLAMVLERVGNGAR